MAREFNANGRLGSAGERQPMGQSMLSIVSESLNERDINRPLQGVSNNELRKVCSAISTAVNRRKKRGPSE